MQRERETMKDAYLREKLLYRAETISNYLALLSLKCSRDNSRIAATCRFRRFSLARWNCSGSLRKIKENQRKIERQRVSDAFSSRKCEILSFLTDLEFAHLSSAHHLARQGLASTRFTFVRNFFSMPYALHYTRTNICVCAYVSAFLVTQSDANVAAGVLRMLPANGRWYVKPHTAAHTRKQAREYEPRAWSGLRWRQTRWMGSRLQGFSLSVRPEEARAVDRITRSLNKLIGNLR